MNKKVICLCNFVTEKEVVRALEKGAGSVSEIMILTGAGSGCGRCRQAVENIMNNVVQTGSMSRQNRLF